MKKILDNYLSVDRKGFDFIAEHCDEWAEKGVTNPTEVLSQIAEAGGHLTMDGAIVGEYLLGNMYNPKLGLSGEVWVTSKVVNLKKDDMDRPIAETSSGSLYLLLDALKPRSFETVASEIMILAPEPLRNYLRDRVSFWAPEICWTNLTNAVNRYLKPSSTDKTTVAIYAILCNCTEEEMIRQFKADGF